jgi:tRNA A22 N-methylase
MNYCDEHKEMKSKVRRSEEDIQRLYDSLDKLKWWVIAGMGSLLIQLIIFIVTKLLP